MHLEFALRSSSWRDVGAAAAVEEEKKVDHVHKGVSLGRELIMSRIVWNAEVAADAVAVHLFCLV